MRKGHIKIPIHKNSYALLWVFILNVASVFGAGVQIDMDKESLHAKILYSSQNSLGAHHLIADAVKKNTHRNSESVILKKLKELACPHALDRIRPGIRWNRLHG